MKQKTWHELLGYFNSSTHARLITLARNPNTEFLVVSENVTLDSSLLGATTALAIGPGRTSTDLSQVTVS